LTLRRETCYAAVGKVIAIATVKSDLDLQVELRQLLLRHSVRFGTFTLASGRTSDIYVDGKLTTCRPEAMPLVGRLFLRKMEAHGWRPDAVGGLTLGADPIAFAVARESLETGRPIRAFVVRKEPKKHGMMRFIEGLEETAGLRAVIVEDVCTTGESTALAIERAREAGMTVLGALCLVDREAGAAERLRRDYGCLLDSLFQLSELRAAAGRC
jgi:orotate phosphoribosyltransferase